MKIFVVHSGDDRGIIGPEIVEPIVLADKRAKVLVLGDGGKHWKREAAKLLDQAQMVLFVVGEKSHASENIGWELKRAIAGNKEIVYLKLNENNKLHPALTGIDRFTKKENTIGKEAKSVEDVIERVRRYEDGDYPLFNFPHSDIDRSEVMEQYKTFLETSERLVERRQTVNNFYLSANTALCTIMAAAFSALEGVTAKLLICFFLSITGIILSISWRSILDAYGILNSSKMKVISIIERNLPLSLYDTEWAVMSDNLNSKRYVSFTDSEKKTPMIFVMVYIVVCFIGLGILAAMYFLK